MISSDKTFTSFNSCEVLKPSKIFRKGIFDFKVAAVAIMAMSCASCALLPNNIAKPVDLTAITSLWSPKIDKACVAKALAAI